ncbi:stage II sporulation protein D [Pelosinus sp. UFO1]|uniref:stage II sporulation protein D n=1 Tax=Pelosinus sp. UFO1 TaxID=484770 RepID=UPI0004D0E706|nr:stage II sporulation protein D [Pelosinus sp. UFO1]AIF53798.1 stage II sporulation protein D [Pelosinus sp. UFO1]
MKKIIACAVLLVLVLVIIVPALVVGGFNREPSSDRSENVAKGEHILIRVYLHEQNKIVEMNLEEYIKGVVAAEMPAEFELEALKAQAVAARTYAVKSMVAFGGSGIAEQPGADVSTDFRQSQAWQNETKLKERWGTNYDRYWSKISRAVEETRGQVATYNGELIQAVFHSTSGERTASAKEVWGFDYPYLISVPCNWDQKSPRYHDKKEFTLAQVEQILGPETQVVATMQNGGSGPAQIVSTTESGRVGQVRIGSKILSGAEIREKMDLRSSNFNVAIEDGKMVFNTIGYGHGVGLCQYGANGMAKDGHDFRQIITQYYTGVALKNIYAS